MPGNSFKYVLMALTILTLAALGCGGTSTPTLPPTPAPTRPVIPTPMPGRYGIFIMRLDGTELRQIYSTDQQPSGLRPSADGSQILFQFYYRDVDGDGECGVADMSAIEIGLLDIDGSGFRRLTDNDTIDALPLWSPDGTEILFTSNRGDGEKLDLFVMDASSQIGRWDIFVADVNNPGNERNLTNAQEAAGLSKWSPDGQMILFVAYRVEDGNPAVALYTIGADGSDRQKVDIPLRNFAPLSGAWMPDGEHIVFAAEIYR